jgi:hypothetical protein
LDSFGKTKEKEMAQGLIDKIRERGEQYLQDGSGEEELLHLLEMFGRSLVHTFYSKISTSNKEDFLQELRLSLILRLRRWKREGGPYHLTTAAKYGTSTAIENYSRNYVGVLSRNRYKDILELSPLEEEWQEATNSTEKEGMRKIILRGIEEKDPELHDVIILLLAGKRSMDIQAMGIRRERIDEAKRWIKEELDETL